MYLENIRLDEDVLKTFFCCRRLRLSSSRRLGQDQYIRLGHTSSRRLQDVFKTSCQDVIKTPSKRLQKSHKKTSVLESLFNKVASLKVCETLKNTYLENPERQLLKSSTAVTNSEAVIQRCSVKKMFIEISQNSQGNTCARVSFFNKVTGLRHRHPVNFVKFLRTPFFIEYLWWRYLLKSGTS